MRKNNLSFQGLQKNTNPFNDNFYKSIFNIPDLDTFQNMKLEYKSKKTGEYLTFLKGDFNIETILLFLNLEKFKDHNIQIYLQKNGCLADFLILGDPSNKDERDYNKQYTNISFSLTFEENVIDTSKYIDLFDYYKSFFLTTTVPIRCYFGTIITDETTNGKYKNQLIFRHKNKFPFTGILICWKMILGELYYDEDYTSDVILKTPALYSAPLLKQVEGKDYNLIELHTYKDFYNYESDESMKSLRETYGYLRETMLELEEKDLIPPLEKRFQL
ncbi:hypothetical protein [Flammeovirga sp. SJP92]|uniref:hypothetical protein n=1 Tax=Flammeovirga sp. SJP92 TaxID=1775430 RepID=UPI000787CAB6|nr:hypothetical protein [Flammeovirga sp. SJP92]KXX69266.1 hypothetical protein AVL50_20105 [Flammeovirga sp. SJP92]